MNESMENYINDEATWLKGVLPSVAVNLPITDVLDILSKKFGEDYADIFNPEIEIASPLEEEVDGLWLQSTNMVGVNVRTIGNFFNIIKYALTLPAHWDSIHLLPIWEPGVVSSLYGIASRNINTEFFSEELYEIHPHLDTSERQLQVVINILHALGKSVGMDVIPHTDRFSEIVLANPSYFEWLQKANNQIVNYVESLDEVVQEEIFTWLKEIGSATPITNLPQNAKGFFSTMVGEEKRLEILFGLPDDVLLRNERRGILVDYLYKKGFEPVPATMAPPYRGLKVSPNEENETTDEFGRKWRDYEITEPQEMSRVFGPLTRFKFYERKNNNQDWEIDFEKPRVEVWEYFKDFYAEQAEKYRFDFMRGDMSHVQMRATGVPSEVDEYYDPHKAVKNHIAQEKAWFAYFAETFLTHANYMAYGDEIDHIEMSDSDSTLGNLQSITPGTTEFLQTFRYYWDILKTRFVAPNFTIMTADKDDPRFDKFYEHGNEARFFTALFLPDMPSYYGLGFECRDTHLSPAPNEHYTKLYVFQIGEGPKATHSSYIWGGNEVLFDKITRINQMAEDIYENIAGKETHWLLPPDATGYRKYVAWTQAEDPTHLFVVNWDAENTISNVKIPAIWDFEGELMPVFSTERESFFEKENLIFNGYNFPLNEIKAGECLVFTLQE